MESFPHSGAQLASVHPCKHASVMKKFIDRMEAAQSPALTTEPETISSTSGAGGSAGGKEEKEKKKKWGLGGMVRKVTGGSLPKVEKEKDEVVTGVPVDFYLVIVCLFFHGDFDRLADRKLQFLKFIASIVPTIEVDSTTSTAL